jgi:hypothetical protein
MRNGDGHDGWQSPRGDLAIDHAGPTDTAFARFDDAWIEGAIASLFNDVAARAGDKLATVDETRRLTFRQLQRASQHHGGRVNTAA